ncbi:TrkH family potassium uptake protein [Peptostreptococcus russellii]|uniref:Trk system potassium uptake protein TrkH n=1 Tax=Peptostreptococcus russellii TaxID=215200 RepID=A0A1H8HN81_9FIRM|nr:TrkH family potassium uptake protein [Peptostreptococcus russellii]MBC2578567.1 TrkH family potassium uptake protein [Peptostreptococcus russellii]SEN57128.1 trk system potassium uptake protein TrkH [Peptostreptococcus russellii]
MNYEMVVYVLLNIAKIEGVLMMIPGIVSLIYGEYNTAKVILTIAILLAAFGFIFTLKKPRRLDIFAKDGLFIVGIAWITFSLLGALPFYFTGSINSYVNAVFETVSGFTTTGSTILTDIESLPNGILFWRSFTHWIGGMGVLVFVLAIIPLAGSRSMNIMKAEVPGPTVDKLVPKTKQTAKILYFIYVGLTILQVIFLVAGKMPLFDSILTSFSTAGTGGFSNKNNSIAYYDSAYVDGVVTVFMILFGINFNLFYLALLKKFKRIFKSEELRTYIAIIAVSTLLITFNIRGMYPSFLKAFRYASFQVATIITTTGFMTADFNVWPMFSKAILLLLMIVGACAGSTGGGLKVSRVLIMVKHIKCEIKRLLHPRAMVSVKIDKKTVETSVISSVLAYLLVYFSLIVISFLLISINEFDFETSLTSVITCINNVGPGLGAIVGPTGNFSSFSDFSKIILCFDMLLGRLEIFPILLLFSPRMYKRRF